MLSRNLIKANRYILKEKEPVVLDSNELFAKRIEILQKEEGFSDGLDAVDVEPLILEEEQLTGEDGELIPIHVAPVYEGPTPEELIAKAQEEIEIMKEEAEKAISFLKKRSMEEGREEGYRNGQIDAMRELEEQKIRWKEQDKKLEERFQKRVDELEVQFIEAITGIYEEIFQIELSSYKPILMNAISNTIRNVEGVKDFIIHVSKDDYKEVVAAKAEMIENMVAKTVTVEIVEDFTLKPNECIIETNTGIYDCGIGSQVTELKKRLRLLSYEN